jgi:hypothetical protein
MVERKKKNQVDTTLHMISHEIFHRRLGANSGLIGTFWKTESGDFRPRTTGDKGQWSGIRYNMNEVINSQSINNYVWFQYFILTQSNIILYIYLHGLICST